MIGLPIIPNTILYRAKITRLLIYARKLSRNGREILVDLLEKVGGDLETCRTSFHVSLMKENSRVLVELLQHPNVMDPTRDRFKLRGRLHKSNKALD